MVPPEIMMIPPEIMMVPPEIMMVPLKWMALSAPLKYKFALNRNICQIHLIYASYGCKCSSKK